MSERSKEVELIRVPGGVNAESIVTALHGRGIPARSHGEAIGKIYGLTLDGLGEVSIFVPEEHLEAARAILDAGEQGDLLLGDDDMTHEPESAFKGHPMQVAEKYRGLSQQQLLEKAYELGVAFEKYSGSCSQCTAAALREILGFEDVVVRIATSSCGGQAGYATGACGGFVGGTIVLDYYLGRPADMVSATQTVPQSMEALGRAMESARLLGDKFVREYGSTLCPLVQTKIYGRSFDLQNPDDWKAFEEAGAHSDPTKCMRVVGNATRWTLEILIEKKAITL